MHRLRLRHHTSTATRGPGMFNEPYEVSLDYRKPDGFWVHNHRVVVTVPVAHGVNEKNNHDRAEAATRRQFPGCRVNSVTYC